MYASVSGTVEGIDSLRMPNGSVVDCIVIASDGQQTVWDGIEVPTVTNMEELLAAVADGGYDVLVGDTLLDGFIPQESACRHVEVPHVAVSSRISWDKPVPLFGEGFLAHVREALR